MDFTCFAYQHHFQNIQVTKCMLIYKTSSNDGHISGSEGNITTYYLGNSLHKMLYLN